MNNEKMKNGFCPFMTRGVAIPSPRGVVDLGAGRKVVNVDVQVVPIPCKGADCQLWDDHNQRCCMVTSPFLDYSLERLANNLPTYSAGKHESKSEIFMNRIADTIEQFLTVYKRRKSDKEWMNR